MKKYQYLASWDDQTLTRVGEPVVVLGDSNVSQVEVILPSNFLLDPTKAECRMYFLLPGEKESDHDVLETATKDENGDSHVTWTIKHAHTQKGGRLAFSLTLIGDDAQWDSRTAIIPVYESRYQPESEEAEEPYTGRLDALEGSMAAIRGEFTEVQEDFEELKETATLGTPIPESLVANMQEGHIYVYTGTEPGYTAGHVYYYVGGALTDGGQYGGTTVDATLTVSGAAADAKVTGDKIAEMKEDLSTKSPDLHTYGLTTNQYAQFEGTTNLFSGRGNLMLESAYYREPEGGRVGDPLRITTATTYNGYLVRVKPGTAYIMGELDHRLYFYDANFIYLGRTNNSDIVEGGPNICTTPADCYWMSLTFRKTRDLSNWMLVEGDTYPDTYISGYPRLTFIPKDPAYLTNKRIAFFGDSITAGSGTNKTYHEYIAERYGFNCLNYGYGGSGYVTSYTGTVGRHGIGEPGIGVANTQDPFTPNNVLARLAEPDPTTLDGAVIFAGTNDWSHHVELTEFSAKLDETYTYYQTNYGAVPLVVMLPIHRLNDTTPEGKTMMDYCNIIIQKCREYGIPYVDTLAMSGLQPNNTGNRNVFFPRDDSTSNDGIHPNHIGHERIMRVVGEVLNGLVKHDDNVMR